VQSWMGSKSNPSETRLSTSSTGIADNHLRKGCVRVLLVVSTAMLTKSQFCDTPTGSRTRRVKGGCKTIQTTRKRTTSAHASTGLSKDVPWNRVVPGLAIAGFTGGTLLDGLHSRIPLQVDHIRHPCDSYADSAAYFSAAVFSA
jgi:hypothetical protein